MHTAQSAVKIKNFIFLSKFTTFWQKIMIVKFRPFSKKFLDEKKFTFLTCFG